MFNLDPTTWLLVFLRISAMLAIFPVFSTPSVPVQLRVALAAAVTLLIVPTVTGLAHLPPGFVGLVLVMMKEVGVGLLLGYISRLIFYVLEFAGNLVAAELGMNWGASLNPFSSSRSEAPGLALFYLGAILFLTLNMHHWLLLALQRSYEALPIGGARLSPALFADMVSRANMIFLAGLLMSAPVIAVSFLINLVFSVIGRAVPQMNVFVESFSFRALAGLGVFGLALNMASQHAVNYLRRLPEDLMVVAQLLSKG
jgi:flagellar biosynthetic protein FliR